MDGIRLSSLKNKIFRINGSRKSKGQFSFVQKIKYFYLLTKYGYFKIEKFSDVELSELISLLNMKEITYTKAIAEFEKQKTNIDDNLTDLYAQIGSIDPKNYNDMEAINELSKAGEAAINDKKAIDKKIASEQRKIKTIEKIRDDATSELEAREINKQVQAQEIMDELELAKSRVEEKQVKETSKEEPIMEEKVISPVVEPISEETVNTLEDKIIENVEEKKEETKEVKQPVESVQSEPNVYDELVANFNNLMNNEYKLYRQAILDTSHSFIERISTATKDVCAQIQEQDRKEAEALINDLNNKHTEELNAKEQELTDEKDKNAKLEQANNNLTKEKEDLIKENESKDAKIKELEAALAERNTEIAKRDEEITSLNNKVDEVEKARQAAEEAAAKRAEAIKAVLFPTQGEVTPEENNKTL